MVQLLFVNVIGMHLSARAAIKLSKMHYNDDSEQVFSWCQNMGVLFLFVWYVIFGVSISWIEYQYLLNNGYYSTSAFITMIIYHGLFVVATALQCGSKFIPQDVLSYEALEYGFGMLHMSVNFVFKLAIASIAFHAAKTMDFEAPQCNLWGF